MASRKTLAAQGSSPVAKRTKGAKPKPEHETPVLVHDSSGKFKRAFWTPAQQAEHRKLGISPADAARLLAAAVSEAREERLGAESTSKAAGIPR